MTDLLTRPAAARAAAPPPPLLPPVPSAAPDPGWFRIRPAAVVWRPGGLLQVGLDDDPCVILPDAPPQADRLVRSLGAGLTVADLARLFPEVDPRWVEGALARLHAGGLSRPATDPHPPSVALYGAGPLAEAVAGLLAGVGVDLLVVEPRSATAPEAVRARAERWRAVARRHRRGARADLVEAWQADASGPALAIVCPPTIEPDRGLTDALVRAGRTHLVVRCEPARAVVGPMVVPGRTPCVRCGDRERIGRDPQWPLVLAQLCLARARASGMARQWAAATGAAQALAYLRGGLPETLGATLELPDATLELQARAWARDPACGCAGVQRDPVSGGGLPGPPARPGRTARA